MSDATPKLYRGEYSSVVGVPIMAQLHDGPLMVAAVMPRWEPEKAIALADKIVAVDDLYEAAKKLVESLFGANVGAVHPKAYEGALMELAAAFEKVEGKKR